MLLSAKRRFPLFRGGVVVPLLVSLVLHGLLFLLLWFWPVRTSSPTLAIESTRITLDTCVLGPTSSMLLPPPELPPELLGQEVDTALAPRLEGLPARRKDSALGSQAVLGNESRAELPGPRPQAELGNAGRDGDGRLFPLPFAATRVVYVIDRSVSMGIGRKLDFARRELIASLRRLPPTVRFQVIIYNDSAEPLAVDGQRDLLPAEPAIIDKAISLLQTLQAAGATNPLTALRRGLTLRPDVLYFLTDADDLTPETVAAVTQQNQHSAIHTIELTHLRTPHPEGPLAQLARHNHGTYRRVTLRD